MNKADLTVQLESGTTRCSSTTESLTSSTVKGGEMATAKNTISIRPKRGDIWEHADGGSIYVRETSGPLVHIQRRPFGDSQAIPRWIRLATFAKIAVDRLKVTA